MHRPSSGGSQARQHCTLYGRSLSAYRLLSGGWTEQWCPPEAQRLDWEGTAEGDIFALGLVLWCIAVEVDSIEREHEVSWPPASSTSQVVVPQRAAFTRP
ncbi:hypothetical protein B0H10DRAFT_2015330 [Mycena sp. CBHHK59/15]|nr:hypothetical protein B0H10DRAFT_2015330 [Mycena sp. CBHHK59/15]